MDPSKFQSSPHASGNVIITDVTGNHQADTLKCIHCQHVWVVVKGSGRKRGFCTSCMGPTCGSHACMECDHFMKKIERAERQSRS